MDRAFQRLVVRARPFGNHARKYLRTVERRGEEFLSCLDRAGRLGRVHTDRCAPSLADDFDQVVAAGTDTEESLRLLGVFYAIQFLHQNARSLERLAFDLAEAPDRLLSYRTFLQRIDGDFSRLVSTYMIRALRLLLPSPQAPYLVCSVGTRGHQDDIDVAVLDEGGASRPVIDHAFARLSIQMLRYASAFDHYLSGSVGADGYCVSIEELRSALKRERPDFVVVTELLRAEPLTGSRALYGRLRREIIAEFLYRPGEDNTRHELYMRGVLGEIRALLLRPPTPDSLHPKDDGLRLVIGLTSAMKAIEGLQAAQPRDLLSQLSGRRPDLARHLVPLEDSLVFLETFRHVFHLLVAEEEEVAVEGPDARDNLESVAAAMGYRDRGPVRAADQLLVNYHEAVESIHKVAPPLMEEAARHLAEQSRFSRWTRRRRPEGAPPDLARQFARALRSFRGVRFWDDLLEALSAPDGRLLGAFVDSFAALPREDRRKLALEYADWGSEVPYTFLNIATLVARHRNPEGTDSPAVEITGAFLERLGGRYENIRAFSRVFRFYPDLMNRFLLTLEEDALDRLHTLMEAPIGNPEVAAARDRLQEFIRVHRGSSRYVKRVLARVTLRHPATVLALSDDRALRTLAQGRLATGERHPRPQEQIGLLGDFYDMEFLRIAMGTSRGTSRAATCAAFTELTTTYLTGVFDVCLREAEREAHVHLSERALPAIYLSGGTARGRPYDEDYDLVALTAVNDPGSRELIERSLARLNRQIARRGVIAQYRFGDRTGRFATGLDELAELLSGDDDDLFIDRCQLLSTRPVVDNPRVEHELVERIFRPLIFDDWESFVEKLAGELRDRREGYRSTDPGMIHIKEMPGGLREIDLCLAAAGARLGRRDLAAEGSFHRLSELEPDRSEDYDVLGDTCDFLVHLRSIYRVTVAASDVIERDFLEPPARMLGYGQAQGEPADLLFEDIKARAAVSARAVDRLLAGAGVSRPRR